MPMTQRELPALAGVGQRKLERFGEAFMDLIIDYCRR
ncbi:HRDC domain-containing protein [Aeromonas bivalvium]